MKESEKIYDECLALINSLKDCLTEYGWKARYLGYCSTAVRELNNCKLRQQKEEKIYMIKNEKGLKMAKYIPKIEDSFPKQANYPSVTERYYKQLFFLHDQGPPSEHHCVLIHSNKICLITLAPTHPVIKEKKNILRLDFQVTNKVDRLENKVSGKGKKGGQHIMPDSILCFVECDDGSKYTIWGCIKGKLVEINQQLLTKPNLIVEKPLSQGYVAIILPSFKDLEVYKSRLLTQKTYESNYCST